MSIEYGVTRKRGSALNSGNECRRSAAGNFLSFLAHFEAKRRTVLRKSTTHLLFEAGVTTAKEREIFVEALEKGSPDERRAFLDRACGDDSDLRSRIELLLESHKETDILLDHPILGASPTETLGALTDGAQRAPYEDGGIDLDFLEPSNEPDSLGRLAQYEVQGVIGRGGMGIVLGALDIKLNRVVAIKVLAPELAANATARKRFLREAQAAAAVSHDHVVTLYAVEEHVPPKGSPRAGLPYLVMEFVDGPSLQQKLDQMGHLELKEILRIGRHTAVHVAGASPRQAG